MKTSKSLVFADAEHVEAMRPEIDAFLRNVLSVDEQEHIASYFISDEATLFDCSMGMPTDWQQNCRRAYGVDLSTQELTMRLWRLVELVRERSASV